jgi:hypothetical protein
MMADLAITIHMDQIITGEGMEEGMVGRMVEVAAIEGTSRYNGKELKLKGLSVGQCCF